VGIHGVGRLEGAVKALLAAGLRRLWERFSPDEMGGFQKKHMLAYNIYAFSKGKRGQIIWLIFTLKPALKPSGRVQTNFCNTAPRRLMPSRMLASLAVPKLMRISLSGVRREGSGA